MNSITDVTGRINLRQDLERLRRRFALLVAIAVMLLVGVIVWVLWFSPVFVTKDVRVSGIQLLTPEQVTSAASVPIGLQLLRVDTRQVAQRVASLPEVNQVTVVRVWPDRFDILVTERSVAYAAAYEGLYYLVDPDGVVFRTLDRLPDGVVSAQINVHDARCIRDVALVLESLPADVRQQAVSVEAGTYNDITITLGNRDVVVWGSTDESELKSQVLQLLLNVEAKVYDVSSPTHPTTR